MLRTKNLSPQEKIDALIAQGDLYYSQNKVQAIEEYDNALTVMRTLSEEEVDQQKMSVIYYKRAKAKVSFKKNLKDVIEDFSYAICFCDEQNLVLKAKHYYQRGEVYYERKRYEKAKKDFNEAVRLGINRPNLYHSRGLCYFYLDDYKQAIQDFTKAIDTCSIKQIKAMFCYDRGIAYLENKGWEEALKDFHDAVYLDPERMQAHYHCALIYFNQENYEKAIISCANFLEKRKDSLMYVIRGRAYVAIKNHNNAITDFEEAIRLNANYAPAYTYLGAVHRISRKNERAMQALNKAIILDSTQCDAYYHRGYLFYFQEKWIEAFADFNKALELNQPLDKMIEIELNGLIEAMYVELKNTLINEEKLKQKTQSEVLQLIKILPSEKQVPLLISCLNNNNVLGGKMWEQEGWSWKEPNLDSGILRDICHELKELVDVENYQSIIASAKEMPQTEKEISLVENIGLFINSYVITKNGKADRAESHYQI